MRAQNLPSTGHDIGDRFTVGQIDITVTPADHAWQNDVPGAADRTFQPEDCCGFWLATPDGIVWAPGDSRLIPDHHLHMPTPDAMLFDFSDSEWHFGLEGAITMANAYPDTPLLLHHWGCVDAPDFHRSTPTPPPCRAGSSTRTGSSSWHRASRSTFGPWPADDPAPAPERPGTERWARDRDQAARATSALTVRTVSPSGVLLAVAGCGVLQHRHLGQTLGAQLLFVNDPHATTIVPLVQTASTLPMMLLALPAGVLADAFDRRLMLLAIQVYAIAVAVLLAVLTAAGMMPPALMLAFVFAAGAGMAMNSRPGNR